MKQFCDYKYANLVTLCSDPDYYIKNWPRLVWQEYLLQFLQRWDSLLCINRSIKWTFDMKKSHFPVLVLKYSSYSTVFL